jgi:hypothetical protein
MRFEERAGHLVMLCVGRLRLDRDRTCAQFVQQRIVGRCAPLAVVRMFVAQALPHQRAHPGADQRIWQPAALAAPDQPVVIGQGHPGGRRSLGGGGHDRVLLFWGR